MVMPRARLAGGNDLYHYMAMPSAPQQPSHLPSPAPCRHLCRAPREQRASSPYCGTPDCGQAFSQNFQRPTVCSTMASVHPDSQRAS
eukprot:15464891-Alexandrium_andersonii.AAC.1